MKDMEMPEVVNCGIYDGQAANKNKIVTKNRKTTMFELELPLFDGGTSYINDTSHPIRKNTVIVAKPGQTRHTRLPFTCYYVKMIVKDTELYSLLEGTDNFIRFNDTDYVKGLFEELTRLWQSEETNDRVKFYSLLLKLIYTLCKEPKKDLCKTKYKANNHKTIAMTLDYIKNNLASPLTLDIVAKEAKFTPIYFHKLFKASTGKTLRDYVEEQRINLAIRMLLTSQRTLSDIAYECGFSSQSYFSYAFKRRTKLSPKEYLRSIGQKYEE